MIKDAPSSRDPQTAMRDLLRSFDRELHKSTPTRPTKPPPPKPPAGALLRVATTTPVSRTVRIGGWLLSEDPATGDLIATHDNGTTGTLLRIEEP